MHPCRFTLSRQPVSCTLAGLLCPDSLSRAPSPVYSVPTACLVHPRRFTLSRQHVMCTLAGLLCPNSLPRAPSPCPNSLSRAPSPVYSVLTACHMHPRRFTLSRQPVSCALAGLLCPDSVSCALSLCSVRVRTPAPSPGHSILTVCLVHPHQFSQSRYDNVMYHFTNPVLTCFMLRSSPVGFVLTICVMRPPSSTLS